MPLTSTQQLIKDYGQKIIKKTITDDEICALMEDKRFQQSTGYVDPNQPITDKNHTKLNALQDFVITLGPQLSPENLHQLTERLIRLAPRGDDNTFMRGSSLEKCFLAYELVRSPQNAETHFQKGSTLRDIFTSETAIENLKGTILGPGVLFFRSPRKATPLSRAEQAELTVKKDELIDTAIKYSERRKISPELAEEIKNSTRQLADGNGEIAPYQTLIQLVEAKERENAAQHKLSGLMNFFVRLISRVYPSIQPEPNDALSKAMKDHMQANRPNTGESDMGNKP
ncbi:MAG: VipE [Gammaproteobacteria bacterium]|nr:VipE [Gammaproteobacteria bacterium]